ncbi:agmatinase [Nakamurella sp. UYEF19]|uniref:agmatinase n=1 Tax=Nakamurella sp. UYEF19 TaxID=1756392 RepID=UPI0033947056
MSPRDGLFSGGDGHDHTHPALDLPYGLPDWAFEGMVHPAAGSLQPPAAGPAETADINDNLGLPTFGNRDWVGTVAALAARRPDVVVVGAPFDINTTFRAGARFGPKYLRSTAYDPGTYHLDLGIELYDWLDVVDHGDACCPHGQTGPSLRNIERKVAGVLAAGALPIVIGGDHSITWPSATAVARRHGWGKLGLLHFDAHADTADIIEGNLASHGTPMRRLIESGAVRGRNFVQVGLRGYWPPPETFDWMQENEMTWHLMHELWDRGVRPVIADAIARAIDGCDALYLSVDIDVLDPGFAPGTGTPEPGGMNPADLLRAVRSIALETPLVGMDVVEVSPPYDHADTTVNNAHRVVLEALAGLAHKKRERAGGDVTRPGYRPDPASLRYPADG